MKRFSDPVINHPVLNVEGTEHLPPDDRGSGEIYSRLGYKLTEAVADVVDNSIDAKAKNILIRFERTADQIRRVIILDDGKGLNVEAVSKAMRVGSSTGKTNASLGKYGIGLKSASLSQAKSFKLLSSTRGVGVGRRWTLENIQAGWLCEKLNGEEVAKYLSQPFGPITLNGAGTMVVWEDLLHLKASAATIDAILERSIKALLTELGVRFHRFVGSRDLNVFIDAQSIGMPDSGIHVKVVPLDPFSYAVSGMEGYPKAFEIDLPPYGKLKAEAHLWPPKSNDPGYKLGGGKVSSRQGFYFYRNERLIQIGGWNGSREDDNEPHLSLARVVIDLPPAFDSTFQLDVTKSKVVPPPEFPNQVLSTKSRDGASFKKYLIDAQTVYRRQKTKDGAIFKHTPGKGFPTAARDAIGKILWQKGSNRLSPVGFTWKKLDPDVFVDLDRNTSTLVLNTLYRKKILQSQAASAADAPLIKLLLLFLFHDELDRKASSEKYREWLDKINSSLVATCNKGL